MFYVIHKELLFLTTMMTWEFFEIETVLRFDDKTNADNAAARYNARVMRIYL